MAELCAQHQDEWLPAAFLLGQPLLKNVVDATVVGSAAESVFAIAKNQHSQPGGILYDLV